jgi:methylmalonyl-CoA/ethylmalonyl-CoA epimerase
MSNKAPSSPKDMFSNCVQIGIVVADIDRAMNNLTEIFGIGPFRIIEWPPDDRSDFQRFYYGEPGDFSARMAFTELGMMELELIQPLEGKSIWADFLKDHGEGIHHIRFNVDDNKPVLEYLVEHGVQSTQHGSGLRPGTTWVNLDTQDIVGFTIEIMNVLPGTDGRTPGIVGGKVKV